MTVGLYNVADFGVYFGNGLYSQKIDYFIAKEFAKTAEDILWRRTKLGMYLSAEQQIKVSAY